MDAQRAATGRRLHREATGLFALLARKLGCRAEELDPEIIAAVTDFGLKVLQLGQHDESRATSPPTESREGVSTIPAPPPEDGSYRIRSDEVTQVGWRRPRGS